MAKPGEQYDDQDNADSSREVMGEALKQHFDKLWMRAKRERLPRESKWRRNLLTADGEGPGLTGDREKSNDDKSGREKLRVARQKLTTAKGALGESVYKSNRVPFVLKWRKSEANTFSEEDLAKIKSRVEEILSDGGAAMSMRDAIEDGATYGEYWLHGVIRDDDGQFTGGVEIPDIWEMFVDPGSEDKVEMAEYVVRRRSLTPFEVWQLVGKAQDVFDVKAVSRAVQTARSGAAQDGQDDPKDAESGRVGTDTVEWREVWAYVPERLVVKDQDDGLNNQDEDSADKSWVPVMAIFVGDEAAAFVITPGPRPYARYIWDRERTSVHPCGIYDAMECTQEVLTGVIRSWLCNLRESSHITLAGHRDRMRQDAEEVLNGIRFLDLDPDTRDVRQAMQQLKIEPLTQGMIEAIEMLLTFADLESNIPRILQGQQPQADQTAFEIRNRLLAAGKYLGEVVRRHDAAIVWLVGWVLHIMALQKEVAHEQLVDVRPLGFATYSDLVQKIDGLIRLLDLGGRNDQVGASLRVDWISRQIATAEDIDTSQAFLSAEELQAQAEAQAQSEERQLALAEAQTRIEGLRAKAARDAATAEELRARGQLGRAKFVKDVEDEARREAGGTMPAVQTAGEMQQPKVAEGAGVDG